LRHERPHRSILIAFGLDVPDMRESIFPDLHAVMMAAQNECATRGANSK
jgi:hypothetical protein